MRITRQITRDLKNPRDPYEGIPFEARAAGIESADGTAVGAARTITVPKAWSVNASNILLRNYLRRAGVPDLMVEVDEPGLPPWLRRRVPAPNAAMGAETDARAVFRRIAGAITYSGWKGGYFGKTAGTFYEAAEESARAFFDELQRMMALQMAAPNSPQWFNTGLAWAYGITGPPQGHWRVQSGVPESASEADVLKGPDGVAAAHLVQSADAYSNPQTSACYILSVKDDLVNPGGIMDLGVREARVFKYGSGCGTNVSTLRGEDEPLSGGGVASGPLSWMRIMDRAAGAIKSGGTTRRAAKLWCMDDDHPDLEAFVKWKVYEEQKVAALIAGSTLIERHCNAIIHACLDGDRPERFDPRVNRALAEAVRAARRALVPEAYVGRALDMARQGYHDMDVPVYDRDWQGTAYQTVSGQNANNSVSVSNAFMRAVEADGEWGLYWRTEKAAAAAAGRPPAPARTVRARQVWADMALAAWACADPGVQFKTTMNEWHTCPETGPINATNPCCFVGETLVDTSEGLIRIDRLAEMAAAGQTLPMAFAFDTESRRPVLRRIKKAWAAGHTSALVRVTTDKGVSVTCTPEHRFLTYGGGYVRADRLTVDTSLRKIARHVNKARSGRVMMTDRGCGNSSGTEYQSIWMWEQAFGPVPPGYEVHHRNGDAGDDRLSNFEAKEKSVHRSEHSAGSANNRFIEVPDALLVAVYDHMSSSGYAKCRGKFTVTRWNKAVRSLGLVGKVPLGRLPRTGEADGAIQGVAWSDFVVRVKGAREAANDKVTSVEVVTPNSPVPVYDIEVDGTNNFGVTNSPERGRHSLVVHNSEFAFLDDTSCNLASLNLFAFYDPAADRYDVDGLRHAVRVWTVALEVTVHMSQYPSREIAARTWQTRSLGLGFANLGGLLMAAAVPYDSPGGRAAAGVLAALVHFGAYAASAEMAAELGPYAEFPRNRKHALRVVRNHRAALYSDELAAQVGTAPGRPAHFEALETHPPRLDSAALPVFLAQSYAFPKAVDDADRAVAMGEKHGYRNAQVTCVAPTGCLVGSSLVMTDRGLRRMSSLGDPDGPKWQDVEFNVATDFGQKRATKFHVNGTANVVRVKTSRGYTISGTPEHRIRVVTESGRWEWRRFGDIRHGERVPLVLGGMFGDPIRVALPPIGPEYRVNAGRGVSAPPHVSEDLAFLVGLFHAEGSLHDRGLRFALTASDADLTVACRDACESVFGVVPTSESHGGYTSVCLNSTQVVRWWAAAGFAKTPKPGGGKGHVPSVPEAILATNDPIVYGAYLRGLFSGDGTVTSGLPSLSNANAGFVDEVRSMLLALGVVVSGSQFIGGKSGRPVYRITVSTARYAAVFSERVGFSASRKQSLITTGAGKDQGDRVYGLAQAEDAAVPVGHPLRSDLTRFRRSGGGVPRRLATEFGVAGDDGRDPANYFYDTIESAELVDDAETFDLSVPENVTYVAQGFVSHNTIGLVMDCDTTGCEPDYALVKFKTLAGGGHMKIVNQRVADALRRLGYEDSAVQAVVTHMVGRGTIRGCPHYDKVTAGMAPDDVLEADRLAATAVDVRSLWWNEKDRGRARVNSFTPAELEAVNMYVCGAGTVEGAGRLKASDLPVFDCAGRCGRAGTRTIRTEAHVRMLAAIQPFVSGAISKTINMSKEATVDDFEACNVLAWRLGCKAVAAYRDESKLSQVLSSGVDVPDEPGEQVMAVAVAAAEAAVARRRRLPDRRHGYTQKVRIAGHKMYVRTGEYEDGTLGEIFIDMHKEGASFRALANCFRGDTRFFDGHALRRLEDCVGQSVAVTCADGVVRPATVQTFGRRKMVEVVLKPTAGRGTKFRRVYTATPDHRWVLRDGSVTTSLKVGDVVRANECHRRAFPNDDAGFMHGVVFGDGSQDSKYRDRYRIRLCGEKKKHVGRMAQFARSVLTPDWAKGDTVLSIVAPGRELKRVPDPETCSPAYICSFIAGWIATDGGKGKHDSTLLCTQNQEAAEWLIANAPYYGYEVVGHTICRTDTNYGPRSAPLHRVTLRVGKQTGYLVTEIVDRGGEEEAYCVVEPETHTFMLEGGVVTGNCFAIAVSLGLQHGVPLDEYVDAFLFTKFEPQGIVQGHPNVKLCTSIVDVIVRDLAITYLGRHDLCHVPPESMAGDSPGMATPIKPPPAAVKAMSGELTAEDMAHQMGYSGDACPHCHHMTLVSTGVCKRCNTCGATSGCS